ncbi:glycophorin-binding protein, partial [Plasmodium falciparum NF54]
MRLSKVSDIKSTGVSNYKNFNSKNSSKYSLMEVSKKNEKKNSLGAFHSKKILLIFGIIYVVLLNAYICGDKYEKAVDYGFRESRILAEGEDTCARKEKTTLRKSKQKTSTRTVATQTKKDEENKSVVTEEQKVESDSEKQKRTKKVVKKQINIGDTENQKEGKNVKKVIKKEKKKEESGKPEENKHANEASKKQEPKASKVSQKPSTSTRSNNEVKIRAASNQETLTSADPEEMLIITKH